MVFASGAQICWACYSPPQNQLMSVDRQIALASDVSVAKVIRATALGDGNTEYEFLVQERIAGPFRPRFTIVGHGVPSNDDRGDFGNHTDEAFWRGGGGRLFNDTDCVIHPTFVVGASYLAFVGQTITRRSFERIATSNGHFNASDKWLAYVETALRGARQPR